MSYPGLSTSQLTPELLQQMQQYQDQQRQQALAQSLMGNKASPNTAYAGIANAGGDVLGAEASQRLQQNAMQQAENNVPGQMVNLGNGIGSVSSKTPNLPNPQSWLSGLFSMGGS